MSRFLGMYVSSPELGGGEVVLQSTLAITEVQKLAIFVRYLLGGAVTDGGFAESEVFELDEALGAAAAATAPIPPEPARTTPAAVARFFGAEGFRCFGSGMALADTPLRGFRARFADTIVHVMRRITPA